METIAVAVRSIVAVVKRVLLVPRVADLAVLEAASVVRVVFVVLEAMLVAVQVVAVALAVVIV